MDLAVSPETRAIEFRIDKVFVPYVAAAAARLEYTNPELQFQAQASQVRMVSNAGVGTGEGRRLFMHALYREKVLAESVGLRMALLKVLGGP